MDKGNTDTQENAQQLDIQRIYLKDLSFEAPNTPHTFIDEWKPEVTLNLETKSNRIQDNSHEVILSVTATVTTSKKTAFLIEVHLAGVFSLQGFTNPQLHYMLGSVCPTILFPYAREIVSDIVVRGGFPQLILAPVNFDALYNQHLQKQQTENESSEINSQGIIGSQQIN
ncbi:MAG TPA: protein-export chaperone SecB [Gammaproteobacteria bacterium]|nr:protein-export chaperone SecB [Gammaproteobacteria bacterium]